MLPTIRKDNLSELDLSPLDKKQVADFFNEAKGYNGFRFAVKDKKCVAIGKKRKNDFEYFMFADRVLQHYKNLEKFRFILTTP